ncbi:MAG: alanine racemase [Clostridia bacterium]|nr:alanine racemase [Clostridia bacterium]
MLDIGFVWNDEEILEAVKSTEKIHIEGCFTHFSKAIDEKWTRLQFARFQKVIAKIKEVNPDIKYHCCNSTAFLKYEDMFLDYVRLGSCLQGRVLENPLGLKKIGKLKTEIITIKNLKKGYNISYSNEYQAPKDMKVAVIGVRLYGRI